MFLLLFVSWRKSADCTSKSANGTKSLAIDCCFNYCNGRVKIELVVLHHCTTVILQQYNRKGGADI